VVRNNGTEPLSVPTDQLSHYVTIWIDKYRAERPYNHREHGRSCSLENTYVGALDYLASQSGLAVRAINRVIYQESKFTSLSLADQILTAMERHDLLDNEINVVPNPRLTEQRFNEAMREAGCG